MIRAALHRAARRLAAATAPSVPAICSPSQEALSAGPVLEVRLRFYHPAESPGVVAVTQEILRSERYRDPRGRARRVSDAVIADYLARYYPALAEALTARSARALLTRRDRSAS